MLRCAIITVGVVACVWIVSRAAVSMTAAPQPPWLTIVLTIMTAIGVGSAPGAWALGKIRFYMKHDHQRVTELEASIDPARSTSGLNKDGTCPDDL